MATVGRGGNADGHSPRGARTAARGGNAARARDPDDCRHLTRLHHRDRPLVTSRAMMKMRKQVTTRITTPTFRAQRPKTTAPAASAAPGIRAAKARARREHLLGGPPERARVGAKCRSEGVRRPPPPQRVRSLRRLPLRRRRCCRCPARPPVPPCRRHRPPSRRCAAARHRARERRRSTRGCKATRATLAPRARASSGARRLWRGPPGRARAHVPRYEPPASLATRRRPSAAGPHPQPHVDRCLAPA